VTTIRQSGVPWLDQLAAEIRYRLRAQRTTQAALAAHAGITPKHLSQILTGAVNGSPEILDRVAAAMGLRIMIAVGDCEAAELPQRVARAGGVDVIGQLEDVIKALANAEAGS
jgi:transcriptional regulator with XRE-family HTH domain